MQQPLRKADPSFVMRMWDMIISPKLCQWIAEFVNARMPATSGRGTPSPRFEADEIGALCRLLVGCFNSNSTQFDSIFGSAPRLGWFKRLDTKVAINRRRFYRFLRAFDLQASDVHSLFDLASEGLRSVVSMTSKVGTAELALDESMLPWQLSTHKWVVFIPRKPKPTGLRAYLLASKLNVSQLPIALHAFPDTFDTGFWKPSVCRALFCD